MKVFSHVPRNWGATIYYRVVVPFQSLEKAVPDFGGIMEEEGSSAPQAVAEAFTKSDLALVYQPISDGFIEQVSKVKKYMTLRRPAVIVDTDDNLFHVSAYNHAFKDLGIKRPDGSRLRKGDAVIVEMDSGAKRPLYRDGMGGFNVVENWYRLECFRQALQMADLVTCSTPAVEKIVHAETGNLNTFVTPNHVMFEDYDKVELAPHPNEVRILWQGSPTHILDLFNIKDSVIRVAKKYPFTKWIFWGHDYPPIGEPLGSQYQHIPWCDYKIFRLRLATIGHDIALAPLATESNFEECRSAIKWYESSAIHHPAATLAQKTGAFATEMEDGQTGMLFTTMDEFETKLCTLIENASLRQTLAANAQDWVHEHRDAVKYAPILWEKWKEVVAKVNPQGGEMNGKPAVEHNLQPS